MAGTFQDRLVTELRLAEAATIDDANRVLADFLPRFNQRFCVPPQHAETAYRVLDPQMCLDTTLCLKYKRRVGRDNTVKYRWRTLQLLPGTDRPSYAGAVVDVLEGLDGQLAVQHEGQIIPTQEAPQRPNILRDFTERTVPTPSSHLDSNGLGRTLGGTSSRSSTSIYLATAPTATAPEGFARPLVLAGGSPHHFRRRDGKRYGKRSARGCPFVGSPGNWHTQRQREEVYER